MYTLENPELDINKDKIKELKEECKDAVIVAATKYITEPTMKSLYEAGINNFGENRVEPFIRKHFVLREYDITWHFLGHLQRNKAKFLINDIDYLHSLDSLELCKIIDRERKTPLKCFIELKMVEDSNKNGVLVSDLDNFIKEASSYKNVCIVGLMAMTEPEMTDNEKKELFENVVSLGKKYNLKEFSLGMSDDYKEAIASGSTHIRLGRILYKG